MQANEWCSEGAHVTGRFSNRSKQRWAAIVTNKSHHKPNTCGKWVHRQTTTATESSESRMRWNSQTKLLENNAILCTFQTCKKVSSFCLLTSLKVKCFAIRQNQFCFFFLCCFTQNPQIWCVCGCSLINSKPANTCFVTSFLQHFV